jgi:hypothetical protein
MNINFTRQFHHLKQSADEILKENGVYPNGLFYYKLEAFINFYYEIKDMLIEHLEENSLAFEKAKELPELTFVDYDNPISIKSVIYGIGYYIFFPIGIVYIINKYRYVSEIKTKLQEIKGLINTIEFLTKEK